MAPKRKASTYETGDSSRKDKGKKTAHPELTAEEIFRSRSESTSRRKLWLERDVSHEELGETPIFDEIRRRRWEMFVSFPKRANRKVVQEFYAAMDPDAFERGALVTVRRKTISMTAAQINEYLQTPSYPQWEDGYAPNPIFDHYDRQFAVTLTGQEDI